MLLLTHAAGTWDFAGLFFGRGLVEDVVGVAEVALDDEDGNVMTDGEVGEGKEKVGLIRGNSMNQKCQQMGREKRNGTTRRVRFNGDNNSR